MGKAEMFCFDEKDSLDTLFGLNRLQIRNIRIGISFGMTGPFIDFVSQGVILVHDISYGIWK